MKIALGADGYGFDLKQEIKNYLVEKGLEIEDVGINDADAPTPYYQTASEVAKQMANRQVDRAILICGTGMGMAIIANKHPGIYAAPCENTGTARMSRSINNSNILTLGGLITTPRVAQDIVDVWLNTEFTQDWESPIQAWLHNSMKDIAQLETQQFSRLHQA